MAYANGQFPSSAMSGLATAPGQALEGTAARQWDALAASVRNTYGWTPYLTDSYRPYSVQERIFLQRYDHQWRAGLTLRNGGIKHWRDRTWYKKPGVAVAASPGTSNHGWGIAVDCSGLGGFGGTRYAQLASLAGRFGYSNANGRAINEPWHWEFTGAYSVSNPVGGWGSIDAPSTPGAPAPIIPKDWLMALTDDEQRELLELARYLKKGGEGDRFMKEIPTRVANEIPALTAAEQKELLANARHNKPGGENDRFIHEIPSRVTGPLQVELAALRATITELSKTAGASPADVLATVDRRVNEAVSNLKIVREGA